MSNKTRILKSVRRKIRREGNAIGRKLAEDLLSLPLWERIKFSINIIFKKAIFVTK